MIDLPIDLNPIWDFMECPNLETLAVDSRIATSFTQDLQEIFQFQRRVWGRNIYRSQIVERIYL